MKTVIFDMDGLMFDTEMVFSLAWDYAGEKIGIGKVGYMNNRFLGVKDAYDEEIWRSEVGDKFNADELKKYTKEFISNYYTKNSVPVKKGLYMLLHFLRINGYRLAVASSSSYNTVIHHLKDADVYEYFEVIVSGDMVSKSKPDSEIYLKVCELLKVDPKDCYALEDSLNGLMSAHNAGCTPIMVPDLIQPTEEIKSFVKLIFKDLDEVRKYFRDNKCL